MAETAGDLRSQLESVLAENQTLKTNLRQSQIRELIGQPDYRLVLEGDLDGVPDDQLKSKAEQIQGKRVDDQRQLLKRAGLNDEQVDKVLAGESVTHNTVDSEQLRAAALVAAAQGTPGTGLAPRVDESATSGRQAIKAYFAEQQGQGSTEK